MIINSHDSNLNVLQFFFRSTAAAPRYKWPLRVKHASIKLCHWAKAKMFLCCFLSFSPPVWLTTTKPLKSWMCRVLINKIIISACKRCLLALAVVSRLLVRTCSGADCQDWFFVFKIQSQKVKLSPSHSFVSPKYQIKIKSKPWKM